MHTFFLFFFSFPVWAQMVQIDYAATKVEPLFADLLKCEGKPFRSLWLHEQFPPCRDQGPDGLCFAFATAQLFSSAERRHGQPLLNIDPLHLAVWDYENKMKALGPDYAQTWMDPRTEIKKMGGHEVDPFQNLKEEKAFLQGRSYDFRSLYVRHRNLRDAVKRAVEQESKVEGSAFDGANSGRLVRSLLGEAEPAVQLRSSPQSQESFDRLSDIIESYAYALNSNGSERPSISEYFEIYHNRKDIRRHKLSAKYRFTDLDFVADENPYFDYRIKELVEQSYREGIAEPYCDLTKAANRNRFVPFIRYLVAQSCRANPAQVGFFTGGAELSRDGGKTWKRVERRRGSNHAVVLKGIEIDGKGKPWLYFIDSGKEGSKQDPHPSLARLPLADFCQVTSLSFLFGPRDERALKIARPASSLIAKKPPKPAGEVGTPVPPIPQKVLDRMLKEIKKKQATVGK